MNQAVSRNRFSVSERVDLNARRLNKALFAHMEESFPPVAKKVMRKFTPAELAEFTGASPSNIRRMHAEGLLPDVETDSRGRRMYSLEEIDAIRHIMATTTRGGDVYLPGKRPGDHTQIISFANLKGGSSKTSSTVNVGAIMATRGYKVLLADLDGQASLTSMFGFRPEFDFAEKGSIYDALRYKDPVPLSSIIQKTFFHNIDLAPASLILTEYETETAYALSRKDTPYFFEKLSRAFAEIEDQYDLILVDCPPNLGFITLSALAASTGVIIPIIPNMLDVASMGQFMQLSSELVKSIEELSGPMKWDFMKFLISRFEPSDGPQTQMAAFLRSILRDQVFHTPFLKSTAIADAGMTQQTVFEIDRSKFNKKTIDRIHENLTDIQKEIEREIHMAWGREIE
jgi:chromosome partitioning protein